MNDPDAVVGAIAVTIATSRGRMTLSSPLSADLAVKGETLDDLNIGVDMDSLRHEVVGHLHALAQILSRPDSDLTTLFEMEMK